MSHRLVLLALWAAVSGGAQETPSVSDLREARERERVMGRIVEAARSKSFYLVVDASSSTLSLELSGVTLATYSLESVELGLPAATRSPEDPLAPILTCRAPRREPLAIEPGRSETDVVATPPGEPEPEPDPADRVTLTCDPPLLVQVVQSASLGTWERLLDRFRLPGEPSLPRVRLVVASADAPRLYASLPEEMRVIISRVPLREAVASASTR